jgi:hypothetical protein
MKLKLALISVLLILLSAPAFAQSIVITGRKVTYKRPKPMSEYKKTFTIRYPKVKASTPALSKKIESAISYQKILNIDRNDELHDSQWLEEADYKVEYNKNGILGVELSMDGSAAYPSGMTRHVVVDTRTGTRQRAADVFTNLAGLSAKVRNMQKQEIAKAIVEIKKEQSSDDPPPDDLFKETIFGIKDLNEFSVDDKGVTFHYDYGFPHVILAMQPEGEFRLSWTELRPFIKPGGLLTRIAH